MAKQGFSGKVKELIDSATRGTAEDVDYILSHLTPDATLSLTRFVDYALSFVESEAGLARVEYFGSWVRSVQSDQSGDEIRRDTFQISPELTYRNVAAQVFLMHTLEHP